MSRTRVSDEMIEIVMTHPYPDNDRWREKALCRGLPTYLFFKETRGGSCEDTAIAKTVCQECPVLKDCLVFAVAWREEYGIWGATNSKQRRILRRISSHRWHRFDRIMEELQIQSYSRKHPA